MPELRNYQQQVVADIRARFTDGARRVLYQAPTGSGKTVRIAGSAGARGMRRRLGHVMGVIP